MLVTEHTFTVRYNLSEISKESFFTYCEIGLKLPRLLSYFSEMTHGDLT